MAGLFAVTTQDLVWVQQLDAVLEDQSDRLFARKYAANVVATQMSKPESVPTGVGPLGHFRDCGLDQIPQALRDQPHQRRMVTEDIFWSEHRVIVAPVLAIKVLIAI